MKHYTGQQTFAFNKMQDFRALIPDPGVSVAVEFWNGEQFVADEGSPVTSPEDIGCLGAVVRLTPDPISGGFGFDSETGL